jgi:hypothetical protein
MIIISGSFFALMAIAAFVIDLGVIRMHRSEAQAVVDAASAAGSLEVGEGNGQSACVNALGYVELNLGAEFDGVDCTTMSSTCNAATPAASSADTTGDWTLTLTYPVPDGHALMDSSAIGATPQLVDYRDGFLCERIGVTLQRTQTTLFGGVIGQKVTETSVHAVAVTRPSTDADTAVNLVILERYDCDAIVAEGSGGGTGGIWVDVVVLPDGTISPGYITVDSDGTGSGCGGDGVIDVDGGNSQIRADGPSGCPQQIGTHPGPIGTTTGEGCGIIQVLAPGTPGCNPPACTNSGTVLPDPADLHRRVTRAPIDHRYNCKGSYSMPAGWEIRPCPDTPDPHIDDLVSDVGGPGAPADYTTWTSLGHPCTIEGPPETTATADGDIYVDCPTFTVRRNANLTGGNVVFQGDVVIEGQGALTINGTVADPLTADLDAVEVVIRNGSVQKAGQATFAAHNAMVHLSPTSQLTMAGGANGTLIWTSPNTGDFAHLALWSDSPTQHHLAGQAYLDLEGVFFTPIATVVYSGNGVQHQIEAQFVTRKLKVQGQGVLIVRPSYDSAVLIPADIVQLIR